MKRSSGTKAYAVLFAVTLAFASVTVFAAEKPKLSMAEAKKIALDKHPGKIKSAELETENGVQQYSFDIKTTKGLYEIGVNANDGSIVEDKMESASAEKAEKAADAAAAKKK